MIYDLIFLLTLVLPLWFCFGVFIVSRKRTDYSQLKNILSELGARDSETESLSPKVNNYPLGALFLLIGLSLFAVGGVLIKSIALLIMLHGLGSIVAGYFPMDQNVRGVLGSKSHNIHLLAGNTMFITSVVACGLWYFVDVGVYSSNWFNNYSLATAFLIVAFQVLMVFAVVKGSFSGLYQRLSYGSFVVWLSSLGVMLKSAT